jgi:putative Mn2+ efflux pump MntP
MQRRLSGNFMSLVPILLLSVALAMDAFAASVAIGAASASLSWNRVARVSLTFGCFQSAMPILGWVFGRALAGPLSKLDHWIAFAILAGIGIHMIASALRGRPAFSSDPATGFVLLALAVATSIDALAAGFSLALVGSPILFPAISIGLVTAVLSAAAFALTRWSSPRLGKWAELAGGATLIVIGARILIRHLGTGF